MGPGVWDFKRNGAFLHEFQGGTVTYSVSSGQYATNLCVGNSGIPQVGNSKEFSKDTLNRETLVLHGINLRGESTWGFNIEQDVRRIYNRGGTTPLEDVYTREGREFTGGKTTPSKNG